MIQLAGILEFPSVALNKDSVVMPWTNLIWYSGTQILVTRFWYPSFYKIILDTQGVLIQLKQESTV